MATSSSETDNDEALAVESCMETKGHRGSLVRTAEGDFAFPSHVPQPFHSIEDSVVSAAALDEKQNDSKRHGSDPLPKAKPDTPDITKSVSSPMNRPRPTLQKGWQTELTQRGNRQQPPAPPLLKRAAISYLDQAIWQGSKEEPDTSSSSDDDHGVPVEQGPTLGSETTQELRRESARQKKENKANGAASQGRCRRFRVGNEHYNTKGKVKKDGRLRITVNETANTGYIAKALGAAVNKIIPGKEGFAHPPRSKTGANLSDASTATPDLDPRPRLNIVIMVIGSRGDAQPFLKIGKVLKEEYGHRVRIATHPAFREFVEKDSGLEFFSVGGDPSELMAFMVKNPGMIPTLETVKAGDIGRRRAAMAEMFDGFWRACVNATDDEKDSQNLKMMGSKDPFVADAIIANPPSFAHIHCAEALGIPLHLMFTFPYTPTQAFPHPLASIKQSNVDPGYTNFISYPLVEMMVWQGLGDLVNAFRVKTLNLDPVSTLWAPGATYRLHVPYTYLWSPGLVPKPEDWGPEIDISGFVFLDLASSFTPPKELEDFMNAGEPPIYIGFGSIVVDDADRFTQMIFDAVKMAGVRALVSKGWGGFGSDDIPDNIFMLDNTPHDWLFPRVKACVIHGGAGTTAMALKCGKPTMVVPFFGDQHFWGNMISRSNVGPEPVPYKYVNAEKLADGIKYCLGEEAQRAAEAIAARIEREGDGAENAVKAFHSHLSLRGENTMRCSILKDQIAVWRLKHTSVKLSALAADLLVDGGHVTWKRLRLLRHSEWNDFEGPGEPVTGIAGSVAGTVGNTFRGVAGVPYRAVKSTKERRKRRAERKRKRESKRTSIGEKGGLGGNENAAGGQVVARQATNSSAVRDTASIRTGTTATEATNANEVAGEIVGNVRTGVGQTATAIAKAPIDLSVALAQGFHNAPRLYGDDTVRRPPRITGYRSGLRAARKEFGHGIYDAWTGVVMLPVRGAKMNGAVGFTKGTGMGLVGFVLKNVSAFVGPFGYTLKALVKQAERSNGPQKLIRRARIAQGERATRMLSRDERRRLAKQVVAGWHLLKDLADEIAAEQNQRGFAGQIDKVLLDTAALFEDVETASRALRALRGGETLDHLMNPDREPLCGRNEKGKIGDLKRSNVGKGLKGESRSGANTPARDRRLSGGSELGNPGDEGLRLVQTSA